MRGRLLAKKADIRRIEPERAPGGLTTVGLRHPEQQVSETAILGHGADAAPKVVDLFEEVGLL